MKQTLTLSIVTTFFLALFISCETSSTKNETVTVEANSTESNSGQKGNEGVDIFENPNKLISALSQNGIGELKEWSNPMDMGWGSLTDYYQFGPQKDGVGMQNNIAYYIEGTENKVTKMYINLNINNPTDKQNALKFLKEISEKTFKTLNITMPKELSEAILNSKEFQLQVDGYQFSNKLEKSKIETWKVNIEKK